MNNTHKRIALVFSLALMMQFVAPFGPSHIATAQDTTLIHGVTPTKVTAKLHQEYPDVAGKPVINDHSWEFWNVGALGGDKYSKAKLTITDITLAYNGSAEVPVSHSSVWEGTFSGGPNGNFVVSNKGYDIKPKLNSGKAIIYGNKDSAPVDNPDAFNGWVDKEILTAPTIGLEIIEGPIATDNGKLKWTVKADVTGDPSPSVKFSGDPSDSISTTATKNVINITVQKNKIFELTATANNSEGTDIDSMSFSNNHSNFTLVIPGGFPGFGPKETRIEVKNGVIDFVVPYRMYADFADAHIKGTYDPEKGILNATFTIAPHNDTANLWLEFNGTLKADLSKENTAGFMTIGGDMWQWEEGKDKGPAGDYSERVYYSVEYPNGPPAESADSTPSKEPVDSNLHFLNGPSLSPALNVPLTCFIKRAGSNELEKVDQNTRINVGDTIVNPPWPQGRGVTIYPTDYSDSGIGLQPGTNFTVLEKTEIMTMGEFIYKSQRNPKSGFDVKYDTFEMQLAKLNVKLKGTTVIIKEDGATSSVKVIGGLAEATDFKTGKTVEVGAGQMIAATSTGIGEVQTFDTTAENVKWKDFFQATSATPSETMQQTQETQAATQEAQLSQETATTSNITQTTTVASTQATPEKFPTLYLILGAVGGLLVVIVAIVAFVRAKRKK